VLVHTFHTIADLGEIMHIMLLSICEFREKQRSKCCAFLKGVNEISLPRVL
jgi:hypothetical protein